MTLSIGEGCPTSTLVVDTINLNANLFHLKKLLIVREYKTIRIGIWLLAFEMIERDATKDSKARETNEWNNPRRSRRCGVGRWHSCRHIGGWYRGRCLGGLFGDVVTRITRTPAVVFVIFEGNFRMLYHFVGIRKSKRNEITDRRVGLSELPCRVVGIWKERALNAFENII